MSKVAVVILNWNGAKLLHQFLPSVVEYTTLADCELVVIDNNSTDESIELLTISFPQIRVVQLNDNQGYAGGYNEGLKQIDAEYYVLLNSDVEVSNGWIKPIIDYLDTHTEVAAAQPKILSQRNRSAFEYAGASGGYIDKYGYPFCRGRIFDTVEQDLGQYNDIAELHWATGACLVIRSRDFVEAGGFDETFFAHMEEIDLCWRLNARGRKIVCIPSAIIYHLGGATLGENNPRKAFLNFRNNLLMLYKNLPDDKLQKVMRMRKVLDCVAALKYYARGKTDLAKAIKNAHVEFEKIKNTYDDKRAENMRLSEGKSLTVIYPHSILVDYYLKGKKTFAALKGTVG